MFWTVHIVTLKGRLAASRYSSEKACRSLSVRRILVHPLSQLLQRSAGA